MKKIILSSLFALTFLWSFAQQQFDYQAHSTNGTDTYTASITNMTAYSAGTPERGVGFSIIFDTSSSGACTLNINGLGAITINGDIVANTVYRLEYNVVTDEFDMISGGGGGGIWGPITGTLSDQTDLQNALDAKIDKLFAQRTVTGADAIIQDDNTKVIIFNSASPFNFTIDALTVGTNVTMLNDGAGTVTFVNGSGVTYSGITSLPTGQTATILYDASTTPTILSGGVTSITAVSPLTGGTITGSGNIGINDAAADGSTKGAAAFTAADFNASSGLISIDYTNGQAASGSNKGFLTPTDWNTFNSKYSLSGVQGDLPYYSGSNTISVLNKNTSATRYLSNTGTSNNPAWAQIDLTNGVTGVLPIANGGTGSSSGVSWLLASGGTLTGANTIAGGSLQSPLTFTSAFTANANNQYALNLNLSNTSRGTASDMMSGLRINGTITAGGNSTKQSALLIENTFATGGFSSLEQDFFRVWNGTNSMMRITNGNTIVFGNHSNSNTITVSNSASDASITASGNNSLKIAHTSVVATTINGQDILSIRPANTFGVQILPAVTTATTSAATQRNSTPNNFNSKLWNGSASYDDFFSVRTTASTSTNGEFYYDIYSGQSSSIPALSTLTQRIKNTGDVLFGAGASTTLTPNVTVDINGGVAYRVTTKSQITGNQNDYAIGSGTYFRMSSDASRNVTSITGGFDGKMLIITNVGSQDIVFTHDDGATGTAANRILSSTAGNITLAPNGTITFIYDTTTARWRDIAVR